MSEFKYDKQYALAVAEEAIRDAEKIYGHCRRCSDGYAEMVRQGLLNKAVIPTTDEVRAMIRNVVLVPHLDPVGQIALENALSGFQCMLVLAIARERM